MALTSEELRAALSAKQKNLPAPVLAEAHELVPSQLGCDHARESTQPKGSSVNETADSRGGQKPFQKRSQKPANLQNGLPWSEEAEKGALSSILNDPALCFPVLEQRGIGTSHFFNPIHQTLFNAICSMWNNSSPIDLITFTQYLTETHILDKVGGPAFVTELYTFVPSPVNIDYYLGLIHDKYLLRQIILDCTETMRLASEESDEAENIIALLEAKTERMRRSVTPKKSILSVRVVDELIRMTFDDTDNFLADRVIAAGQACTLLGPGGVGKSRLSMQLAVCMITGKPFLDLETHAPWKKWLFIQTENNNRRLHYDLRNIIAALSLSKEEVENLSKYLFIHTLEHDLDAMLSLNNTESYTAIQALIQEIKPDFIQWDPLNHFTDADLNSDMDMRALVTAVARITREGNPLRVPFILHHSLTGKAGAARAVGWDKASYGRNSKVLQAWTRAQINLAPRSADDPNLLVMSCGKNNNGKPFPEIGVKFDEETETYIKDDAFDPVTFREDVGIEAQRRLRLNSRILLDLNWPQAEIEKKPLVKLLMDETGCGRSAAYGLIDQAVGEKFLTFVKLTRTYLKNK